MKFGLFRQGKSYILSFLHTAHKLVVFVTSIRHAFSFVFKTFTFALLDTKGSFKLLPLFFGFLGISLVGIPLTLSHIAQQVKPPPENVLQDSQAVLASSTLIAPSLQGSIVFNVPAVFNEDVTFNKGLKTQGLTVVGDATINGTQKVHSLSVTGDANIGGNLILKGKTLDLGNGTLTASNILYSLTGGTGISVGTGQTPTITNSDPGSAQDIFKTITVDGNSFSASSNTDTLTLLSGTNVSLSTDTSGKKVTINATSGSGGLSGLTTDGILYAASSTTATSLAPGTSGYYLVSNGTGNAPSWSQLTVTGGQGGNCANCITSNPSSNQTITATAGATGLIISQAATGSADIFDVTNNSGSTKFLSVNSLGNVTLGPTSDLQIGGVTTMKTDNTNLANVNDTFVYDTTADADVGDWTNNANAQASSWYNETPGNTGANCSLTSDTRCGKRPFPTKAIIVITNTTLYIFDAQDNTMWMKFTRGSGFAINGTPVLQAVRALNGVVYIATSTDGLLAIDFIQDKVFQYDYNAGSGGRAEFLGSIVNRNSNKGFGARSSWGQIAADNVKDVFPRVINGKSFVAVSTLGGASVIDVSDQRVIKYVDN